MSSANQRRRVGDRVVITRRGKKGTYVADFSHENRHCRKTLKTRVLKEAIRRATKLDNDLILGVFQAAPPSISVRQAVDDYLDSVRARGRAATTTQKYKGVLEMLQAFLAKHRVTLLSRMTPALFDKYIAERTSTQKLSTVQSESVVIKTMFKWAKSRRLIGENPVAEVKLDRPVFEAKPGPSLDQVNAILSIAQEPVRSQIAILAFTGMRSGELERLRHEDVDLAGNWIQIVSRTAGKTKTARSRKVPIPARLLPILRDRVRHPSSPWVFTTRPSSRYPDGDNHMNASLLNEAFGRLVKRLGYPTGRDSGFVVHSLRHFFETFNVNAGTPQRVIDTWLGHRSDRSMGAVYYRLTDEESQSIMRKVPFGTGPAAADAAKEVVR